jgi:uncharacterized protein YqjF (DUF2071 family)
MTITCERRPDLTTPTTPRHTARESDRARRRMEQASERPFCLADWDRALFIHYEIDPAVLQPHVPFELDLFEGKAYVSLVAFTQRNVRPHLGRGLGRAGRLGRGIAGRCAKPVAEHAFLNLRTYVRHEGEGGIYFLTEWIPNLLDRVVGPATYGLPYRLGRLRYDYDADGRPLGGAVSAGGSQFRFDANVEGDGAFEPAATDLDRFLIERYTAYTRRGNTCRRFRIWHEPWPQVRANVVVRDSSLLRGAAPWFGACRYAGANFSPGITDVRVGPPRRVRGDLLAQWTPAVFALLAAMPAATAQAHAPRWAVMWAIASGVFFACKWITWLRARRPLLPLPSEGEGGRDVGARLVSPAFVRRATQVSPLRGERGPGAARSVAFLFGWVGMDAAAFLNGNRRPDRPEPREWLGAIAKTIAGAACVWGLARLVAPHSALLAGWVGMVGLVLLRHFGTFHLLALVWRRAGVDAAPIMHQPSRSKSLAEFWSVRWNRGFHQLAHGLVFRPALRLGLRPAAALLATFVASGLVHEAVISLPAGGGWGLPTVYFTIQGLAVLFERSDLGRRFALRGRLFALACTTLPLPWLFHTTFVHRVAIPFLHAIGAF